MASLIRTLQEDQREKFAKDDRYYKKYLYFFELKVPPRLAAGASHFWFPLAMPPEAYSMAAPFSVDESQTQGAGLYVEEDGIVSRTITLSGTTGFFARALPDTTVTSLIAMKSERSSFSRKLPPNVLHKISGQRHFHYLQDSVFNTYGDLKQDPATAEETQLVFHNLKDEEAWIVIPRSFDMKRESRVLYHYDIVLTAVAPASERLAEVSEDKTLFDEINDVAGTIQRGIDLAQGGLNDATAIAADIGSSIKNIAGILGSVGNILAAASDFVSGVTDIIKSPLAFVTATANIIDEALSVAWTVEESVNDVKKLPDNAVQLFRRMSDGMDALAQHPSVFAPTTNQELTKQKVNQELSRSVTEERLTEAAESTAPTTLTQTANLGSRLTPGDAQSARAVINTGRATNDYTSTTPYRLASGDTLVGLAARYLGDARLWTHIATTNGLKPPFVAQQATIDLTAEQSPFEGALGLGNEILIPNYDKPPKSLPLLPVLGVRAEEPAENHLLGIDVALEESGGREGARQFTIAVDIEKGATGPKLVEGRDNLAQAMRLRLDIEQGTDVLFKAVGLGRVVGTKFLLTDFESTRAKMIESLVSDPRIASVREIDFSESTGDALIADITAEIRGFTAQENVKVTL